MKQKGKKQNFSMFEVLVVIVVISILSSLIFSSMGVAREEAKRTMCLNNLKQIQTVVEAFRKDRRSVPEAYSLGDLSFAAEYVDESELGIFMCPGDDEASMLAIDDLFEGSSYYYIPTEDIVSSMMDMEEALAHYLVIYDKSKKFHGGKFNILFLHGSPDAPGGIAQTYQPDLPDEPLEELPFEVDKPTNHGHGNNEDGIDSSNKNADKKAEKEGVEDSTDSDGNVVDDEKKTGGKK